MNREMGPPYRHASPELWAGVECTVNRIGDSWHDQLARNGHWQRLDDLDRFAALGIRALRFPVLWEHVAPDDLERPDWRWPDSRLARLRQLGLTPIAGLLHHGSGPRYTSLVDMEFPQKLARYAALVAARYPWLEYFTPVNEPLTTARFSGLYGHWYPHARDDRTFVRTLLQQCAGIAAAMRAIRQVTPQAKLVMTEDTGRTYASAAVQEQAAFDNARRWLSLDLLFGRVDRQHPLHGWLLVHGAGEAELAAFVAAPTPAEVVGLNYYVTSDRLLDERLHLYPPQCHGGNGRQAYADVEAVRGWAGGILGHRAALAAAWERYRRPVALTEVHLGCSREEQLRWFMEAWRAALDLRREGVEVRAVTAWSLLGAFDWNSLLTRRDDFYEPGIYDLRAPQPRPTILARMLRQLAERGDFAHPVLAVPGWWRRPERLLPHGRDGAPPRAAGEPEAPPLLIIGGTGTLGQGFARLCRQRGLPHRLLTRRDMDIGDSDSVAAAMALHRPWAVVNAAGYVRVDDAEKDAARCFRENTRGPVNLAAACQEQGVRLVTFSSDLVFDGRKSAPYHEGDEVAPLNIYGHSKALAERQVLELLPSALVVRCSAFFSPWDAYNFITVSLAALARGETVRAAADLFVSPTYLPDLINACLDLLIDAEEGLWHIANVGGLSWAELARQSARLADCDPAAIVACRGCEFGYLARRPQRSILTSARGIILPPLEDALQRYVQARLS